MKRLIFILLMFSCALSACAGAPGALVYKHGDVQVLQNNDWEMITFGKEVYDTGDFYDPSYPTRLTIPEGVKLARLRGQVIFSGNPKGLRQVVIKKNYPDLGGWYPGVPAQTITANKRTTTDVQVTTPIIPVVEGDYFELEALQCSGSDIGVSASVGTWFAIEIIE